MTVKVILFYLPIILFISQNYSIIQYANLVLIYCKFFGIITLIIVKNDRV